MVTKTKRVTATVPDRRAALAGEVFTFDDRTITITPKPENATNDGFWFCASCGIGLRSNIEKDSHCHAPRMRKPNAKWVKILGAPARHVLCWVDFGTGENQEP